MQSHTHVDVVNQVHYHPAGNPPPYSPPGHAGGTVIITQPTVMPVVMAPQIGTKPTVITCPACSAEIVTRVEYKPSTRTHLIAALLCLCICWPCVCVPYCIESCNNIDHYCPNCNSYVGTYQN